MSNHPVPSEASPIRYLPDHNHAIPNTEDSTVPYKLLNDPLSTSGDRSTDGEQLFTTSLNTHEARADRDGPLFVYQPLPESTFSPGLKVPRLCIRLLHLLPGQPGSSLHCTLELVDLKIRPYYEAISYCWGNLEDTVDLWLGDRRIEVTRNLGDALESLRLVERTRVLWADAVCINQRDLQERGRQVSLMSEIFTKANRVVGWLGIDVDGDAVHAMTLIRRLSAFYQSHTDKFNMPLSVPGTISQLESIEWNALSKMLKRPYFRRAWVVQEIGLAKKCRFRCGEQEVERLDLLDCGACLKYRGDHIRDRFDISLDWHLVWTAYHESYGPSCQDSWASVLERGRMTMASDPRDHVYAFLGHFTAKSSLHLIRPDYTRTVCQVYASSVLSMIVNGDLRVLAAVHHREHPTIERCCPSWVPNWNSYEAVVRTGEMDPYFQFFQACEHMQPDVSVVYGSTSLPHTRLVARGTIVDAIRFHSASIPENGRTHLASTMSTLERRAQLIASPYEDPAGAVLVSTTFGSWGIEASSTGLSRVRECFDAFRECAGSIDLLSGRKYDRALRFWSFYAMPCRNRVLYMTKRGYIGLGPSIAQEGDLCAVMWGACVPFLIRPVPGHPNEYFLIGETYTHGIMTGEAVQMVKRGELDERVIVLR